jgi:hypothetical protein
LSVRPSELLCSKDIIQIHYIDHAMKNRWICFWTICVLPILCFAQNAIPFEHIDRDEYPIKIDGGCNFFGFEGDNPSDHKDILIVSSSKTAFFKLYGKIHIIDHKARIMRTNGYTDRFGDGKFNVILEVTRLRKISERSAEVSGVLTITKGNKKSIIRVHGINEDGGL